MTFWLVVSVILGFLWIVVFIVGNGFFVLHGKEEFTREGELKAAYQIFAGAMTVALVFVLFHWILLLLAVPVFLVYGLYSGVRLAIKKPWREFS